MISQAQIQVDIFPGNNGQIYVKPVCGKGLGRGETGKAGHKSLQIQINRLGLPYPGSDQGR